MPKPSRTRRPAVIAIIPARLASTRFPRKVLADDTGRPLIRHVYDAASRSRTLSRVVVATDSREVMDAVHAFGGECVMTSASHPNGTSRLAEAARKLKLKPRDIVVNVQGDEPEIENPFIAAAVKALVKSSAPVSTVAIPFSPADDPANPNIVKVVVAKDGRALYFSRALIPYPRDAAASPPVPLPEAKARGGSSPSLLPPLRHVGLYVYRVSFLRTYLRLKPCALERTESLEQLRILHHGHPIQVAICQGQAPAGIDTPEQYEAFVARWNAAHPAS